MSSRRFGCDCRELAGAVRCRCGSGVVTDDVGDEVRVALGVVEVDATVGADLDRHQVRYCLPGDVVEVRHGRLPFTRRPGSDEPRGDRGVDGDVEHDGRRAGRRNPADAGDGELGQGLTAERRDVAAGAVAGVEQAGRVQRHEAARRRWHRPLDAHRTGRVRRADGVAAVSRWCTPSTFRWASRCRPS